MGNGRMFGRSLIVCVALCAHVLHAHKPHLAVVSQFGESVNIQTRTSLGPKVLKCGQCGHVVAVPGQLHGSSLPTHMSLLNYTETVLDSPLTIQKCQNPHGNQFDIFTATSDVNVVSDPKAYSYHTWFSGYSWAVSVCPTCGQHLGWHFSPTPHHHHDEFCGHAHTKDENTFHALVLDRLIESEANMV
eukprot:c13944_g1_i1.p1 GENE.c13944_g1_i1~~c13944_g1_i1.p1  ORF type:complete len:188 (+),score=33.15 c13944_g1_i1:1-564(+)